MKFLILALAVASASAQFAYKYNGEPHGYNYARTLSQSQDISPDGQYAYEYSVDNGIKAEESGVGGQTATGRASWTSPEGEPVEFSYTADENGYQATGTHVPATPSHVLRALEYIRSHPHYEDKYYKAAPVAYQATQYQATHYQAPTTVYKPTTTHFGVKKFF